MDRLSKIERDAVTRAGPEPMLAQVESWAAINSGSRNLEGLARMAALYADAFGALGPVKLRDVDDAQAMVVALAKDLAAQGQIEINEGKSDEMVY